MSNSEQQENSKSLESAVSFLDWQNAVNYVFMQLSSSSGSLRKISQMAHKRRLTEKNTFLSKEYYDKYIRYQQFYICDEDFYCLDFVTPKSATGKRRRKYMSLPMYLLFCGHASSIAMMSREIVSIFKESNKRSVSFYGSNINYSEEGKINLEFSNHIYRNFYIEYRKEILNNLNSFDMALSIDFQDFYENISLKILLDNLSKFMHHSAKLRHDYDDIKREKFANFFEYCMHGRDGLPQVENNYMANLLADLYLKFWEIEVISLMTRIRDLEDFKIVRYIDDTYLFLKFKDNSDEALGNGIALSILERISDITYYNYNLRINSKTQSFWLSSADDVGRLRKRLKATSIDGMYFREPEDRVPVLANQALQALTQLKEAVSVEEYIGESTEIQEVLKPLYDEDIQKYLIAKHKTELVDILKSLDLSKIKLAPMPIFTIAKSFSTINNGYKKLIFSAEEPTTYDENIIANYIVANHDLDWRKSNLLRGITKKIRSPPFKRIRRQ